MCRVNEKMKRSKKFFIAKFLSAVLLVSVFSAGVLAEEPEPGLCEVALYRCLLDQQYLGTAEGAVHCLLGYIFCKKYVDKL